MLFVQLPYFLFHQFAQQITGMRFCEASAKDNFNVDEIFLKLVDDILKKVKYWSGSFCDHINGQSLNIASLICICWEYTG